MAKKRIAAIRAEAAAMTSQACQVGKNVCKYHNEPMSKKSAAVPANEIASINKMAPVMIR